MSHLQIQTNLDVLQNDLREKAEAFDILASEPEFYSEYLTSYTSFFTAHLIDAKISCGIMFNEFHKDTGAIHLRLHRMISLIDEVCLRIG